MGEANSAQVVRGFRENTDRLATSNLPNWGVENQVYLKARTDTLDNILTYRLSQS